MKRSLAATSKRAPIQSDVEADLVPSTERPGEEEEPCWLCLAAEVGTNTGFCF